MDTIFALSSGACPAGVAVVRISGPRAAAAAEALCGSVPEPRRAVYRALRRPATGEAIDRGLAIYFPAPASFTGEDCLELHCHGSRAVIAALYDLLLEMPGLRLAEAGEFTRRAFDNGKLDLLQVEGLADLVAAETEAQRRQAAAQGAGALTRQAEAWRDRLIGLRAEVEARLDFSDEGDVADEVPPLVYREAAELCAAVDDVLRLSAGAERVRSGFRIALAGPPNAGKSTLLNAIARRDVAIVTAEPGTTRDVIEVPLDLGGYAALLYDTAGLRQADSEAERQGVARARRAARDADLVLWLQDLSAGAAAPPPEAFDGVPVWAVGTKADLLGDGTGPEGLRHVVSARTGRGVATLVAALAEAAAAGAPPADAVVATRARQRQLLRDLTAVLATAAAAGEPEEVLAERLRQATDLIGRLTGRVDIEQVLDHLFAEFCIGK